MKTIFEFFTHQFLGFLSNISDMLEMIFRLPFRQEYGAPEDQENQKPLVRRILGHLLTIMLAPVALLLNVILVPFRAATVYSAERRRNFLLGLPAVAVLAVVVFAAVRVNIVEDNINAKYRGRARKAFAAGDFALAKTFYGRLIENSPSTDEVDLYNLAIAYSKTGDFPRAKRILNSMAPVGESGYKPAHMYNAILLVQNGRLRKNDNKKTALHWHLKQVGEKTDSPLISHAWAEYYQATEQWEKALEYLKRAGQKDPTFLLLAADLCIPMNKPQQRQQLLTLATSKLEKLRIDAPNNQRIMTILANVMSKQGRFKEAEKLLKVSLALDSNKLSRSALANFYLVLHSEARKDDAGFETEFQLIQKSIDTYLYHPEAYERLVSVYQYHAEGRKQILELLEQKLTSGEKSAMVHFAMSNILWLENQPEDARWHVEQAYKLDPRFSAIANNLAWFLAHEENPDLERAYALAHEIVSSDPQNPRYNDTLATILMKQQRWDEAVTHFQTALPGMKNKEKHNVHKKLAEAYKNLDKPNLARLHLEKSAAN